MRRSSASRRALHDTTMHARTAIAVSLYRAVGAPSECIESSRRVTCTPSSIAMLDEGSTVQQLQLHTAITVGHKQTSAKKMHTTLFFRTVAIAAIVPSGARAG